MIIRRSNRHQYWKMGNDKYVLETEIRKKLEQDVSKWSSIILVCHAI